MDFAYFTSADNGVAELFPSDLETCKRMLKLVELRSHLPISIFVRTWSVICLNVLTGAFRFFALVLEAEDRSTSKYVLLNNEMAACRSWSFWSCIVQGRLG